MHKHKPSTFLSVIFLSLLKYKCLKFRVRKTLNQKEILRQNNLFLFNALYPSLNFLTELCTILLERLCCNYKTDCIISLEKITQVSSQWLFLFFFLLANNTSDRPLIYLPSWGNWVTGLISFDTFFTRICDACFENDTTQIRKC